MFLLHLLFCVPFFLPSSFLLFASHPPSPSLGVRVRGECESSCKQLLPFSCCQRQRLHDSFAGDLSLPLFSRQSAWLLALPGKKAAAAGESRQQKKPNDADDEHTLLLPLMLLSGDVALLLHPLSLLPPASGCRSRLLAHSFLTQQQQRQQQQLSCGERV